MGRAKEGEWKIVGQEINWAGGGSFNTNILWINGIGIGVLTPSGGADGSLRFWTFKRFEDGAERQTSFKHRHREGVMHEILAFLDLLEYSQRLWRVKWRKDASEGDSMLYGFFVHEDKGSLIESLRGRFASDAYITAEAVESICGHGILIL
jgi:hypothetical protein